MEYTRHVLSATSYDQYWNYWIHKVDMTQLDIYPGSVLVNYHFTDTVDEHDDGQMIWNNDIPPLFLKHQELLYCCIVIVVSVGILYLHGVKLWDKY
jgi:hypothetical protein